MWSLRIAKAKQPSFAFSVLKEPKITKILLMD